MEVYVCFLFENFLIGSYLRDESIIQNGWTLKRGESAQADHCFIMQTFELLASSTTFERIFRLINMIILGSPGWPNSWSGNLRSHGIYCCFKLLADRYSLCDIVDSSGTFDARNFWSHVVILMLRETSSITRPRLVALLWFCTFPLTAYITVIAHNVRKQLAPWYHLLCIARLDLPMYIHFEHFVNRWPAC